MSFVGALRGRLGSQLFAAGLAGVGALTCLQQGGWLQVGMPATLSVFSSEAFQHCSPWHTLSHSQFSILLACSMQTAHQEEASQAKGALDPNEWRSFKVVSKEPVTHNTQLLRYPPDLLWLLIRCLSLHAAHEGLHGPRRFATPSPEDESGLFVASCLLTRAPIGSQKDDGSRKFVIRPYTPVTTPDTKGYFDLVSCLPWCGYII